MKKMTILFIVLFFASMGSSSARSYGDHVDFNYFYSSLMPYGEWIEIDYDVYVWRPTSVHYSWSPYTVGRWEYTSHGWYWDSYEPFGWATYHYGRWYNDDYYGWVWMPDYEWAPAWVEWRYNDVYIGWAPLPPYASFRIGVGIHFSINWRSHNHYWNFVTYNHFHHHHINYYLVGSKYRQKIFSNTKYRTNYYTDGGRIFNGGIDRRYVERRSGTKIKQRDIVTTTKLRDANRERSSRGAIEVFKPSQREVQKTRDINKYDIKKSEGRTSLKRDKISVAKTEINIERTTSNRVTKKSTERKIKNDSRSSSKYSGREVTRIDRNRSNESSSKKSSDRIKSESMSKSKSSSRNHVRSDSKSLSNRNSKSSRESTISKNNKSSSSSSGKSYTGKSSSRSKSISGSKEKSRKSYSGKSSGRSKTKSIDSSSKSRNRR